MSLNLGALVATLGVNSAGLVKAKKDMLAFEKTANASLTRINAKLVTTGAAMKKVGKAMTMYLTLPMALVGGAAVKMHMDFESSMSKIVGLVGVAREQVDKWSKDIINIAPQLGKAPKELADAMFFITSAGIRGAEAMDVLEMSAKASVAGLGEVKAVADLVTSAMNAYGIAVLSAEMATDVLTATVREGKAEADALASSMGMVLPIASNMGVAFHEVGAAVAAMTRTGTSAATASMQLRQILASLLKPTQQAEEALGHMKTSSAALRKTIKQDGLLAALMQIRKLTEQYGDTVMTKVFPNIRALSGALDIMGANLEDNIAIFASLERAAGSGAKAFEAAAGTFKQKWKVATGTVVTGLTVLGETIAEELMPILLAFGERIKKITTWFDSLSDVQKRLIIRIAGVIMVAGPLLTIFGILVGSVFPALITAGAAAIKMFLALRVAMLSNPLTAVAVGITAVVTALILFKKKTNEATTAQNEFNESLIDAEGIVRNKKIEQFLRDIGALTDVTLKFQKVIGGTVLRVSGGLDVENLTKLAEGVSKIPLSYLESIKGMIEAEVISMKRALESIELEKQRTGFYPAIDPHTGRIKELQNVLKAINTELEKAAGIKALDDVVGVDPEIIMTMLGLSEELRFISLMTELQGDAFDTTTAKAQIYDQALQTLARKGLGETDRNMRKVLAGLQVVNAEMEADAFMVRVLTDVDEGLAKAMDEVTQSYINATNSITAYNETQMKVIETTSFLASFIGTAFRGMSNVISDSLRSSEGFLKSFGEFFADFIKGLIFRLIAATIAALALAVVLAVIFPGGAGGAKVFKNLAKVATFGQTFKAGLSAFSGFAAGGAVSGPTLALVGEAPGISRSNPEFMGTAAQLGLDKIGRQNITITLKGAEIDGNKLVWLVDEIKRQQGNSY